MPPLLKRAARLVPPLRRLHDAALGAEAARQSAQAEIHALRARLLEQGATLDTLRAAIAAKASEGASAADLAQSLPPPAPAVPAEKAQLFAHWHYLKGRNQLVELDFPVQPRVRHGHGAASEPLSKALLDARADSVAQQMRALLPLLQPMLSIPSHPVADAAEPNWINLAFPALDAMALYGLIAARKPRRFVEIGSGFSTKFARRAIRDHGLPTRIISIDPEPRAEVDAICDEVIRQPLEDVDLSFFESITADDFVFFDGSHRTFQNSDVTVFFTEILPRLPAGTMFGIHDIFLPDDYPPAWLEWYFSEQYMLTCWLLAGDRLRIEFPSYYIGTRPDLHGIFAPMWEHAALAGANWQGGAFFATVMGGGGNVPPGPGAA